MTILKVNEISTLSIVVSEQIKLKNLHNFLCTSIQNSDIPTSKNTSYYFYFHVNTLTYEIVVFEKNSNNIILEPFLIKEEMKVNDNRIKVIFFSNYFIVIKNDKFLILKKVKSVTVEDISLYIEQVYKITDFDIVKLDKNLEKQIDINNKIQQDVFYSLYPSKSFYCFCLFLLCTFISLCMFVYIDSSRNVALEVKTKETRVIKQLLVIPEVKKFFHTLAINEIEIEKVIYINNKLKTTLIHKNKNHLLQFVDRYKITKYLKSLKYDIIKDRYRMDMILEY